MNQASFPLTPARAARKTSLKTFPPMNLSEEQTKIISSKLEDGAGIADIQKLVNDEFGVPMTYMETRFLIDDLNLELAKEPEPDPEETTSEEAIVDSEAELIDKGGGSVRVEVDKIKRPGAALSGTVVFSDGQKANWYVDPYGRLGLDPETEGYQPQPEDIETFQMELQKQLHGPGM